MVKKCFLILTILFFGYEAYSQGHAELYRYTKPNAVISARSGALGISFIGINDDNTALYYNPAGLVLNNKCEINVGLGFLNHQSASDYLFYENDFTINKSYLSNITFSSSEVIGKSTLGLGIGYYNESLFEKASTFEGFNATSSIIANETYNGTKNIDENWAYQLYLADKSNDNSLTTDYNGSMQQESFIKEDGAIHNITAGLGFDLNRNFAIGFGLTYKWGDYQYFSEYKEYDSRDLHDSQIEGKELESLLWKIEMEDDFTAITGKIGIQAKVNKFMRFGVSIALPSLYHFKSRYNEYYEATLYDHIKTSEINVDYNIENSHTKYDLVTPFVYSAGGSVNLFGAVITAGIEYSDVTQATYSNPDDMSDEDYEDYDFINKDIINKNILKYLVPVTTWGFGIEYHIPVVPLIVRASYENSSSPFKNNLGDYNIENTGLGLSYVFGDNLRLDALVRFTHYSEKITNYGTEGETYYSYYNVKNSPLNVSLGMAYRY